MQRSFVDLTFFAVKYQFVIVFVAGFAHSRRLIIFVGWKTVSVGPETHSHKLTSLTEVAMSKVGVPAAQALISLCLLPNIGLRNLKIAMLMCIDAFIRPTASTICVNTF